MQALLERLVLAGRPLDEDRVCLVAALALRLAARLSAWC